MSVQIGSGATILGYSDSKACTVIDVSKSGKVVALRTDKATLLNGATSGEPDALVMTPGGFCAHTEGVQRYSYESDPTGSVERFSLRGNGRWIKVGESTKGGARALIGERAHFYDFNF